MRDVIIMGSCVWQYMMGDGMNSVFNLCFLLMCKPLFSLAISWKFRVGTVQFLWSDLVVTSLLVYIVSFVHPRAFMEQFFFANVMGTTKTTTTTMTTSTGSEQGEQNVGGGEESVGGGASS